MIDLKRPAVRSDEMKVCEAPVAVDEARYPYGTRIHLEKEELEKLGDQVADLSIGDRVEFSAIAEVTSLSANSDEYGSSASLSLQIQQMEIGGPVSGGKTTVRDALSTLRGKPL